MTKYVKYPRTYHLPWSPGATNDDKIMENTNNFTGKKVIVSEKMDGENTTIYNDHIHARSIDSKDHISRTWVKNFWAQIKHNIPEDYRICGENLYAKHSIYYDNLDSYFLGFSVWENNICLSWKETIEWLELLNIIPVPILYFGIYDEELIKKINNIREGYVVRLANAFNYSEFHKCVGKFVRANHVTTDEHWLSKEIILNKRGDGLENS